MSKDIQILEGPAALELFQSDAFSQAYKALTERCAWATVNQNYHFVNTWYETYSAWAVPVIGFARQADGSLTGVFTLAVDRRSQRLIVAGMPQIDYAAWMSDDTGADEFSLALLAALSKRFKGKSLELRYFSSEAPTRWMQLGRQWSGGLVFRRLDRPMMQLENVDELKKALRKSGNRSKYNRLKRLGDVEIHHIKTREEHEQWIDDIAQFCDLRQGAINSSLPFLEDSSKREFHLALAQGEGLVTTTIMTVGGKLAAAIVFFCSNGIASVALFAISPYFAKHSPGKLLVYESAILLTQSKYSHLDLTPGDDWKNRFANDARTVHHAIVCFGRARYTRYKLQEKASQSASRVVSLLGISPDSVRTLFSQVKRITPSRVARQIGKLGNWLNSTHQSRVYSMDADCEVPAPDKQISVSVNSLGDLLAYREDKSWHRKDHFLSEALAMLELGNQFFSIMQDGVLAHFGWLAVNEAESYFRDVALTYEYPPRSAVLFGFYTDPEFRGRGLYQENIRRMIQAAGCEETVDRLYISVNAANSASRYVIEKVGFTLQSRLYMKVAFGRSRSWIEHEHLRETDNA